MLSSFLVVIATYALQYSDHAETIRNLICTWESAKQKTSSLVVHFNFETLDSIKDDERFSGTFRFLQTPSNEIYAAYELKSDRSDGKKTHISWILNHDRLYTLNHNNKIASGINFKVSEKIPFLERYLNPIVSLLDQKRAESLWRTQITKQDQWHSYIMMNPRDKAKPRFWWSDVTDIELVLMNQETAKIDFGMPRRIWIRTKSGSPMTIHIESWQINPENGPKIGDFQKPEDRPGWEVNDQLLSILAPRE